MSKYYNEIKKEGDFWKNHLARLYVMKLTQMTNGADFSHTQRRIDNAENELNIIMGNKEMSIKTSLSPAEDAEMLTKTAEYISKQGPVELVELLMEAHMHDPDILDNMRSAIVSFQEALEDCEDDE